MTHPISEPQSHPEVEPMRSAVERIAAFAAAARPAQLTNDTRQLFKRNILDSLGCAIAAMPGQPFHALREQFEEYRAPGQCMLIGGGKTSADQAALFNSGLVRYVDLLDSYMAPGGLCHPSDNFGTVLAAAEQAGASGEEFMLALAVAYEIQCRFSAAVPVMAKGFNHATQLAISAAASAGKLLGLSAVEIANAIAIATVDNVSLACVHAEPVSQWKGFSPGMTGMRAIYAVSLAKRGFTGPDGLFEGPDGLERMFGLPIRSDWEDPSLEIVAQTVLKKYCSLIHGQPVLEAVLDLKRGDRLVASNVERVRCDVFQGAFDFAGGGRLGSKDHPQGQRASRLQPEISHRGGVARRSGRARPAAAGTYSGAGRAGAARTSGRPSGRAVHRPVSQRAQCPNHDLHQRPADSHERAGGLRGRSDKSYVMGPDRGEISMAERTFRR
jgi:2-methylcitrate dehydratase